MSNEKQETIEDIVKELRGIKGGHHTNGCLSFAPQPKRRA